MKTALCKTLGIEYPIFAFTHCRDVAAAASNAGGFGLLGAVGFDPAGQVIGRAKSVRSVRAVIDDMIEEYLDAVERLNGLMPE